jgi:hypothetical protein
LSAVGAELDEVFSPDALDAVYRATDGIPRLINQVCDHALVLADAEGRRPLDARLVESAWAELQQLPSPWSQAFPGPAGAAPTCSSGGVVEFGHLAESDEPADPGMGLDELGPLDEHLHALEADFSELNAGPTEMELIFDEPACMTAGEFLLDLSQGGAEGGEPVIDDDAVEELVVDRYATLDARKGQKPPRTGAPHTAASQASAAAVPQALVRPSPAANISYSAEKSLTLAEALVRHATAVEATPVVDRRQAEPFFSIVNTPPATGQPAACISLDLLPPGVGEPAPVCDPPNAMTGRFEVEYPPAAPRPEWGNPTEPIELRTHDFQPAPRGVTGWSVEAPATPAAETPWVGAETPLAILPSAVETPGVPGGPAACEPPVTTVVPFRPCDASSEGEELDLIVVEEDPKEIQLSTGPQAAPVGRQEYRQLFARLRRG